MYVYSFNLHLTYCNFCYAILNSPLLITIQIFFMKNKLSRGKQKHYCPTGVSNYHYVQELRNTLALDLNTCALPGNMIFLEQFLKRQQAMPLATRIFCAKSQNLVTKSEFTRSATFPQNYIFLNLKQAEYCIEYSLN